MNKQIVINHWLESAKRDMGAVKVLFDNKNYHHALFLAHLALEKVIKALYIRNKGESEPPFIHDLIRLAVYSGINLDENQKNDLREINSFNVKGRYEDMKQDLYKKATPEYTKNWITKVEKYILWFQQQ